MSSDTRQSIPGLQTSAGAPHLPRVYWHNVENLSEVSRGQDWRFAYDTKCKVVGPMPPDRFLEEFFPNHVSFPPSKRVKFSKVPNEPRKESDIYVPLKDGLNSVLEGSHLAFYDASNQPEDPWTEGPSKPNLGMFHENDVNRGQTKDIYERVEGSDPKKYVYTAYMGQVYMFVEVKVSDDLDFFTDPPDGETASEHRFTVDADIHPDEKIWDRFLALGQCAGYAHAVHTRQFRTCVYSISVSGTTARLLRWDRSGVVVTSSFNYKEEPDHLASFVWRFLKATDEERGFDLSAVRVGSDRERSLFAHAVEEHVKAQLPGLSEEEIEAQVDRHYWPHAITRLTIGAHSILVSRPMVTLKGVTGRSAMGYWGVDCETGEVVFVKDVWRIDVSGVKMEGAVLEELREAGVRNIPELVCHGDVMHAGTTQTTRTDRYAKAPWVKSLDPKDERSKSIPHVHYRLVTKGAGFTLSNLSGTRELLSAAFDVYTVIVDAYTKANILHQNIAPTNIILYRVPNKPVRVGYLIGWELSCGTDSAVKRDHVPMGTPAFASIAVSKTSTCRTRTLSDDLESILYVVLYCALLWLPVESPLELDEWLGDFFVDRAGKNGGGAGKLLNAVTRYYTKLLRSSQSQAMVDWLNAAMNLHYHRLREDGKIYGPNLDWDDGKAFGVMWKETLTKELPTSDRHENPIPEQVLHESRDPLAMYTVPDSSGPLHRPHHSAAQSSPTPNRGSSKRSTLGNAEGSSSSSPRKRQRRQNQEEDEHNAGNRKAPARGKATGNGTRSSARLREKSARAFTSKSTL